MTDQYDIMLFIFSLESFVMYLMIYSRHDPNFHNML